MRIFGLEIVSKSKLDSLQEAMTLAKRQLEDIGWIRVNQNDGEYNQLIKDSYNEMVKRCRIAWVKNPILSGAVSLRTDYTFGEGITKPTSEDKSVQDIVDEFWDDPDNKSAFTSQQAQIAISDKIQYDGELAFLLFVDPDGSVSLRLIDPITIDQIIKDPLDTTRPLFYKRRINGKDIYISDIANGAYLMKDDGRYAESYKAQIKILEIKEQDVLSNVVMYHIKINTDPLWTRGIPELYRALDWANANTKMNSDIATFINAQAQYAWKMKLSGTKNEIQGMRSRLRQNQSLNNPSFQAGSTAILNDKVGMDAVGLPSSTGQLFETGIRRSLLMICASTGIMEHYFGDPSTGNLATATAMELPMLKKFKSRQKFWEGIYLAVLNFQLDMKLMALRSKAFEYNPVRNRVKILTDGYTNRVIDIDFPPIVEADIKMLCEAMSQAKKSKLIPTETAQRIFMQGAGVNNIDEELKKEFDETPEPQPFGMPSFGAPKDQKPEDKKKDDKAVMESVRSKTASVQKERIKVADSNKELLRTTNGYLKEIASAFTRFSKNAKDSIDTVKKGNEKYIAFVNDKKLNESIRKFTDEMHRLAIKYYPRAIALGEAYVKSHTQVLETQRLQEKAIDVLHDDLIDRNEYYLKRSLAPDLKKRILENIGIELESETAINELINKNMTALERRVGMYGSELWAVGQKAVKEAGSVDPEMQANFIGVEDEANCQGCADAIAGNPHSMDAIPVPGEQECLSNCRHAIQIVGDANLEESDVMLLKQAEDESKKGYRMIIEGCSCGKIH